MIYLRIIISLLLFSLGLSSCTELTKRESESLDWVSGYQLSEGNEAMVVLLDSINNSYERIYYSIRELSPFKKISTQFYKTDKALFWEAKWHMFDGNTEEAIKVLEPLCTQLNESEELWKIATELLAIAYLRKGEQDNCIKNHTNNSCILPIQKDGVYSLQEDTRKAILLYELLLEKDKTNWTNRWLLNVAYQTIGTYPDSVPKNWLIESELMRDNDSTDNFIDIAPQLGVDIKSFAGGAVLDDFNNDGLLDIITSGSYRTPLKLYLNNGAKGFEDFTLKAGLEGMTGGFNVYQLDFDNDGHLDFLVVRGAWRGNLGKMPNSLYRNNGDSTFTDVTVKAKIVSFNPTINAVCADFNHDGWTDIFIGNESFTQSEYPSELYINQRDGTFKNEIANTSIPIYCNVKGLSAADYNNDGLTDLFLSNYNGKNYLMKNDGNSDKGVPQFSNMAQKAGVDDFSFGFTSWFWDYNNDGYIDLYVANYEPTKSAEGAAKFYAGVQHSSGWPRLYQNNGDGSFSDKSKEAGLNACLPTMGANFGDINNDGWLDLYLGTGEPSYHTIYPNRMYQSVEGKSFEDVSSEKGLAHIQKGHGIAFGDIDNDGDQDILAEMGGFLPGDPFQNALFKNPGNDNNWVIFKLVGTNSSKDAIGTKVKLVLNNGIAQRTIYRTVSSGGSFGSNSLQLEIGLEKFNTIDSLIITWPNSAEKQIVNNITVNNKYFITERDSIVHKVEYFPIEFKKNSISSHKHHNAH